MTPEKQCVSVSVYTWGDLSQFGAKDDDAGSDFSIQWNWRHLGMEASRDQRFGTRLLPDRPMDWNQRKPVSGSVGSWGQAPATGLPSWNRGPGLRRRGYFAQYQYRPPPDNLLYYSNGVSLGGDPYSSLRRVNYNRRQLDVLSGLGGFLGGLPGKCPCSLSLCIS